MKPVISKGVLCKFCKEPVWILATDRTLDVVQAISGPIYIGTNNDEITKLNPESTPVLALHFHLCPETKVSYS